MKRGLPILVLLALLLIAAACGGSEAPDTAPEPAATGAVAQAEPTAAPAQPTATPVPATSTPEPPTATPEPPTPEAETEPTLTAEQLRAFEDLESYRALVTFSSLGQDAEGNEINDTAEFTIEYTKDPMARRMSMTMTDVADPSASPEVFDIYQIGSDMYMNAGEEVGWVRISNQESPFDDPNITMLTGGGLFSDVEGMERVRPDEEINGIDSRHYRFDETALDALTAEAGGEINAQGDLWIAKDGGFLTKYAFTMEVMGGNAGMLDPEMVEGTFEMTWELSDVNSDIQIELPEEATAGAQMVGFDEAFPAPEGASIMAASTNFAILETEMAPEDVAAFYEEALAELGWTKDETSSGSFGGMFSLAYTKDPNKLTLLINKDEQSGKTQIMANAE